MFDQTVNERTQHALECLALNNDQEALIVLRSILEQNSEHAAAWHALACHARKHGNEASAIALVGRALRCKEMSDEDKALYHITLGAALLAQGQAEPSRAAFVVARALNACDPRASVGLAEALIALGRVEEGRLTLEYAITLASDDAPILTRLAELHLQTGSVEAALVCFRRALERQPADGRVWANLGAALYEASLSAPELLDEAERALEQAIKRGAQTPETLNTRALVRMALGQLEAAKDDFSSALVNAPHNGVVLNNLATVLEELGHTQKAEAAYDALAQREVGRLQVQSIYNRAVLRLAQGRYAEGWSDFEARRLLLPQAEDVPQWDGSSGVEPVAVTAEQGLGDQVQFMRYLKEVVQRRPVRLRGAFAELARFMPALPQERLLEAEGPVAANISLLSLPAVLREGKPAPVPYLSVNVQPEAYCVGVCFSGGQGYRFDRRRSVPRELLTVLRGVEGVRFVSLQRVPPWDGCEQPALETLEDLLRAAGRCALVVSVDTLAAHIAGALGRPLWLVNRFGGDWRWRQNDWYESCQRIFQPRMATAPPQCWPPVLDDLACALHEWKRTQR
ncbi:hypothetical protein AA106555_0764 [Neokomagataea thailandica NBRC 106555]|uniref:Tetratricopeptide repeat protein n=2 Tax=Neokomagataea TaxID=1223423 RepID=A0A4Y6V5E9_9PROT|nr:MULTISPECIES: tetratricopeptide repeat protein [Neokomagataea]QDH25153.1 tetratricopeptide repeat protein [Neokomagataea tanensis]GBR52011.1 hypothetical protein AA106555_0764 [Neokomagataea thailandica NBRC 106555]